MPLSPAPGRRRRVARLLGRLRGKPLPRDVGRFSEKLRIVIVSDAAPPQVNGVVRTLQQLTQNLTAMGHEVTFITPDMFTTVPLPTYKEIRLALFPGRKIARMIREANPNAIHIATEGPLGLAARAFCIRKNIPFSTSFHTRFAEYLNARTGIPLSWGYAFLRRFHAKATALMVATPSLQAELRERGFGEPVIWSRGVDTALYRPRPEFADAHPMGLARPVWLNVGRIAVEKNIEAFLDLDLPGTKMVVGEGPRLEYLKKRYPQAHFTGPLFGEELAEAYAAADVFVFPSRTDTFGLVLIEAMATGTPVAGYPVQGPGDVLAFTPDGMKAGALDEDLKTACMNALRLNRDDARAYAMTFAWEACAKQFIVNLALEEMPVEETVEERAALEVVG
ncbi:glycosyltransferase family 1 protein [Parvibaculum sp.]|uniref:glycosyltransferase family 4 protein n=1 Tax=Parvibaculum sp. TaxID=2024848 RepID=UPI002731744A|nr:glycosyltransferase family 1 protein [Parvibaculum sp.]MDP1628531.1 glycosyltransferase family 1 protein [Parvibaculum sp.]MDP2151863.1 glycosyltransferase family 1 protein [Parvibaculum sp.]MDP3326986.1 glycosyltransferase family 1 protein [Parvibaculum sp.]